MSGTGRRPRRLASSTSSSMGTISGGWLTIRARPSTTVVSLRQRLDAVSTARLVQHRLGQRDPSLVELVADLGEDLVHVEVGVPDGEVPALRELPHGLPVPGGGSEDDRRRFLVENPLSRPATARLAASRLTSHSNGPGWVSSKSLMSKTSRRSGEAKTPKLLMCASPHSCTFRPESASGPGRQPSSAPRRGRTRTARPTIRPYRMGTRSATRDAAWLSSSCTGSARSLGS